jgi:cytidylate kinase
VSNAFVVALDGPAASGKSTVAAGAARALGFSYLDTGLLYRALTRAALRAGVDVANGDALARLARRLALEVGPRSEVLVDGRDVSDELHGPAVDAAVSAVSAHAAVREALGPVQRAAVRPPGTILAGRDIGTVIVPDAPLKIWLAASPEQRAARRARQTGQSPAEVLEQMRERDRLDSSRAVAPMLRAPDAIEVDTDALTLDEVVGRVVALVREALRRAC